MDETEVMEIDISDLYETVSEEKKTLLEMTECGVKASFYWDAHGKKIPWEWEGKKSFHKYFHHIKLISVIKQIKCEFRSGLRREETWHLEADGKEIDLGEITSYKVEGNRITLKSCVGAG